MANIGIQALKEKKDIILSLRTAEDLIDPVEHNELITDLIDTILYYASGGFGGKALLSTNPGIPSQPVFYMAVEKGTFPHFSGLTVAKDIAFFLWVDDHWELFEFNIEGVAAPSIELRKTATHIQWKYTNEESWTNLVSLDEISGEDGQPLNFCGSVPSFDDLPAVNISHGDAFLVEVTGHIWIFDGASWNDGGLWRGPQGNPGTDGKEVEFQSSTTHIQWRYVGDETWTNLVPLSELGYQNIQIQEINSAATLSLNQSKIILVDCSSSPILITLPNIETDYPQFNGLQFKIKDRFGTSETNSITVVPQGENTIDGNTDPFVINRAFVSFTFTFYNGTFIVS